MRGTTDEKNARPTTLDHIEQRIYINYHDEKKNGLCWYSDGTNSGEVQYVYDVLHGPASIFTCYHFYEGFYRQGYNADTWKSFDSNHENLRYEFLFSDNYTAQNLIRSIRKIA